MDRGKPDVDERPVVIVGAGFGGIEVARALGRAGIATTIIDRRNHHLFQPLLYQVATAELSPADVAEPIRRILRPYPSVRVVLAEVSDIDVVNSTVELASGSRLPYRALVLATGATHSYFGNNAWAEYAPGLKTIEDARQIRSRLLLSFEHAELTADPLEQKRLMTTAIVGAGPTGVELAGSIAELTRRTLAKDFRNIRAADARTLLIEAGPRVLPAFSSQSSDYAADRLRRLGVDLMLGRRVDNIAEGMITLDGGETISVGTIIWSAGVKASPAAAWLNVETDRAGRFRVNPDLSVPGFDNLYAIGDVTLLEGSDGKPLPGLAQVAKQQGKYLGKALVGIIKNGRPPKPFKFSSRGNVAIVGRNAAVFETERYRFKGWAAWVLWAIIHIFLLVSFQHRVLVSIQWLWRYITYDRGARLIVDDPPGPPVRPR